MHMRRDTIASGCLMRTCVSRRSFDARQEVRYARPIRVERQENERVDRAIRYRHSTQDGRYFRCYTDVVAIGIYHFEDVVGETAHDERPNDDDRHFEDFHLCAGESSAGVC